MTEVSNRPLFENINLKRGFDIYFFPDLDKNEDLFFRLKQTNEKCEWLWLLYNKYALSGYILNVITMAAVSVPYCYMVNGNFDVEHVYHPFLFV